MELVGGILLLLSFTVFPAMYFALPITVVIFVIWTWFRNYTGRKTSASELLLIFVITTAAYTLYIVRGF